MFCECGRREAGKEGCPQPRSRATVRNLMPCNKCNTPARHTICGICRAGSYLKKPNQICLVHRRRPSHARPFLNSKRRSNSRSSCHASSPTGQATHYRHYILPPIQHILSIVAQSYHHSSSPNPELSADPPAAAPTLSRTGERPVRQVAELHQDRRPRAAI